MRSILTGTHELVRSGTHQLLEILAGTHKVVILQKLVCAGTQELVRSACSKKKLVRSWEYSKEIDYVNSSYCGVGVFGNAQTPKLVRPKRTSWCVPQCASCSKKTGNASVGAFRNAGARVFPNAPTFGRASRAMRIISRAVFRTISYWPPPA